jgi:protein KTI12
VVIVDGAGGNYIKGWRYQLFCEAKAVRTSCCCVHVGTSVEEARKINEARITKEESGGDVQEVGGDEEGKAYDRETWENLVFRFEEPNAMARWDSPLFTVLHEDTTPPFEAIWDALIGSPTSKVVVRPNQATVARAQSGQDYLYELDKVTQGVLNQILQWSKDHPGEGGGEVSVGEGKGEGKEELVVELPANVVGLPQLQRLRRQFIGLNRQNAVPVERIRAGFVGFLNDSFESG